MTYLYRQGNRHVYLMEGIFHLKGTVKNYDWGGFSFLPALLNVNNTVKKPFAEYWIGTHPAGETIAQAGDGSSQSLDSVTGPFSYLLKILDVRQMLSIQVHPDLEAAQREFQRENAEGIPLSDPRRNYRDPYDKPELMVALDEFWLLHGFKPTEQLHDILINVRELNELLPVFHERHYEGLYRKVMEMPQSEVDRILQPLYDNIMGKYDAGELTMDSEDFWAAKAMKFFKQGHQIDRGIFSIYFFNLLKLKKGEGIFQPPGIPHAYLEGRNVEIMGSSDNVLRGGLTHKHIDIPELMKHTRFEATYPRIILPEKRNDDHIYPTPAKKFELAVIKLEKGQEKKWKSLQDEVLLLTEGEAILTNREREFRLAHGDTSLLILRGQDLQLRANTTTTIFKAVSNAG